MTNLLHRESVRAFYESIGDHILNIECRDIPESEKEKRYLTVDRLLKSYEAYLEISLRANAGLGRMCEMLRDLALGLEDAGDNGEYVDEFIRGAENFELAVETLGARSFYSERNLG